MKVSSRLKSKLSRTTSEKLSDILIYNSTETLPIYNWIKIHETGNLNYLFIQEDYSKIPTIFKTELIEVWLDLNQQVFNEFGFSKDFERYFFLMKARIKFRSHLIISGDRFIKNEINLLTADISSLTDKTEKQKFDHVVISIEKFMSKEVDPRKTSVKKYYNYLEFINKQNS